MSVLALHLIRDAADSSREANPLPVIVRRAPSIVAALLLIVVAAILGVDVVAAGSATALSHGPRTQRKIALTFDDGVSPANCRRILAELVAQGVPATFFPMAEAIRLDPAFWRLVAEAGDPIGDHTVTHPHMPSLSYAAQVRQLTASRTVVESAIGRPMLDVFRPPYGEYDTSTLAAAASAGFPTLLTWDTSDRDTSQRGTVAEMLAAAERGTNGSVILLHCGPNATPYLLPDVISFYRHRGFRFANIAELLGLAWRAGTTASVTPEQILDGLSPLPPEASGGPLVGIAGGLPPAASPFTSSGSASVGPSPIPSASTGTSIGISTPTVTAITASPAGSLSTAEQDGPTAPIGSQGSGPGSPDGSAPIVPVFAVGGLAILLALLLAAAAVDRRRRR